MMSEDTDNTISELHLQNMHSFIMEMFLQSCNIIVEEDLDDYCFQHCLYTINNTLRHVEARRNEKK